MCILLQVSFAVFNFEINRNRFRRHINYKNRMVDVMRNIIRDFYFLHLSRNRFSRLSDDEEIGRHEKRMSLSRQGVCIGNNGPFDFLFPVTVHHINRSSTYGKEILATRL